MSLKRIAAGLLSFITLGMMGQSRAISAGNNQETKMVLTSRMPTKPVKELKRAVDNANPHVHIRTPKINQRQKRKYLRQNPHLRRSKKNPLK